MLAANYREDLCHVMTVKEAVEIGNVTEDQILYAIQNDHLYAEMMGTMYIISSRSFADWYVAKFGRTP